MHHFTAVTWESLPRRAALRPVWQMQVPRLALSYDYLMHQLLALSAFHLASLHPGQRHTHCARARYHQNEAIQPFRRALASIDEDNCHAIFATSSLLCFSVFASHSEMVEPKQGSPCLENLLEAFLLIRGMHNVLQGYEGIIKHGPIGQLLPLGQHESETPLLRTIVNRLQAFVLPEGVLDDERATYDESVKTLLEWIHHACATTEGPELRVALTWPIGLSQRFMEFMRLREPAAMQLLSFYNQILETMGSSYWYFAGWSRGIAADIGVELDPGPCV